MMSTASHILELSEELSGPRDFDVFAQTMKSAALASHSQYAWGRNVLKGLGEVLEGMGEAPADLDVGVDDLPYVFWAVLHFPTHQLFFCGNEQEEAGAFLRRVSEEADGAIWLFISTVSNLILFTEEDSLLMESIADDDLISHMQIIDRVQANSESRTLPALNYYAESVEPGHESIRAGVFELDPETFAVGSEYETPANCASSDFRAVMPR